MPSTVLVVMSAQPRCTEWQGLIGGQGYEVVAAQSAETALAIAPSVQPDLILLSDFLPDAPGVEVCRRLKAEPRCRLIPIVMLSSCPENLNSTWAIGAGADDFFEYDPGQRESIRRIDTLLRLKNYLDQQAEAALYSLSQSVEAKVTHGKGHSARVASHAVRLGRSLSLAETDLEALRVAGLLHDIGKVSIPEAILQKPGVLSPEEVRVIRQHPIIGEQICAPIKSLRRVLPAIRHHHERLDGSGYPGGLRGKSIPLAARILQVVDIYDALTSDRPYRLGLPQATALMVLFDEVERGRLDQGLVTQFSSLMIGGKHSFPVDQQTAGNPFAFDKPKPSDWSDRKFA